MLFYLISSLDFLPLSRCGFYFLSKTFYKISLKFTDEENLLEKIIIPYLHQNAILPIYEKKKNILKPTIDLIYYKYSKIIGDNKEAIKIQVPTDKFKINHISLIRGTPIKLRSGTPSTHDQLNLEEVNKYYFPLKGQMPSNEVI